MREYKDDVKELETIVATKQLQYLSETRSAKALSKRIDKLVLDLDGIVRTLDKEQHRLKQDLQVSFHSIISKIESQTNLSRYRLKRTQQSAIKFSNRKIFSQKKGLNLSVVNFLLILL